MVSEYEIRWKGMDKVIYTDWIEYSYDIAPRIEEIRTYGASNISVYYEGVEVDPKILSDFQDQISSLQIA